VNVVFSEQEQVEVRQRRAEDEHATIEEGGVGMFRAGTALLARKAGGRREVLVSTM
jgi:hypothetical protein